MSKIKDGIAAQLARMPMPPWACRVLSTLGFEPVGSRAREIWRMERTGRDYRVFIDANGAFAVEVTVRSVTVNVSFTRWSMGGSQLQGKISIEPQN